MPLLTPRHPDCPIWLGMDGDHTIYTTTVRIYCPHREIKGRYGGVQLANFIAWDTWLSDWLKREVEWFNCECVPTKKGTP